jgi:protein-disulfide isomerase
MYQLTDEIKKLLATKHKSMQIVWVPLPILDEIAQVAEKLHLALNQTIIVLTIYALREPQPQQTNGTEHFLCPLCLQSFAAPEAFLGHLKGDEDVEVKPHI